MEEYYQEHDKPNLTYMLIGQQIEHLATLGATDEELHIFLAKGGDVTLKDVATVEAKHMHPKTPLPYFCGGAIFGEEEYSSPESE